MTVDQQLAHVEQFLRNCQKTLRVKSADYAPEGQVLVDILRNAAYARIRPETAMFILLDKHLTALRRYCTHGTTASEPIYGRMVDIVNHVSLINFFIEHRDTLLADAADFLAVHESCTCNRTTACDRCGAVTFLASRSLWDS